MMSKRGLGLGRQETLDVEQNQELMICTKCDEQILGKAMKVSLELSINLFKPHLNPSTSVEADCL